MRISLTAIVVLISISMAACATAEVSAPVEQKAQVETKKPMRKIANIECPTDPVKIIAVIESQDTCYDAERAAQECAWGSSVDVQFAETAMGVCSKNFANMSKRDKGLFEKMNRRCDSEYEKMEGTMYRSMNSFCRLSVASWWNGLLSQD